MNCSFSLRRTAKLLWAWLLVVSGAMRFAKWHLSRRGAIIVLTFHRVLDAAELSRTHSLAGMIVTRNTFKRLSAYVARTFDPVAVSAAEPGFPGKRLRVAFTFDDGWQDNWVHAFPIVREFGIPTTIFICPALTGRQSPFWPERVAASLRATRLPDEIESVIENLKALPAERREQLLADLCDTGGTAGDATLSWECISGMAARGADVGAHTQTHQLLTGISPSTARAEVVGSKLEIERRLDRQCELFAYPNGQHSPGTRKLLVEAGFRRAFILHEQAWTSHCDPLAIPRINISEDDLAGFARRFSRAAFLYRAVWRPFRAELRARAGSRLSRQALPAASSAQA